MFVKENPDRKKKKKFFWYFLNEKLTKGMEYAENNNAKDISI